MTEGIYWVVKSVVTGHMLKPYNASSTVPHLFLSAKKAEAFLKNRIHGRTGSDDYKAVPVYLKEIPPELVPQ